MCGQRCEGTQGPSILSPCLPGEIHLIQIKGVFLSRPPPPLSLGENGSLLAGRREGGLGDKPQSEKLCKLCFLGKPGQNI